MAYHKITFNEVKTKGRWDDRDKRNICEKRFCDLNTAIDNVVQI